MAVRAKLKYGPGLRWDQEYKLIHNGGFYIWSRQKGPDGWVIFAKDVGQKPIEELENTKDITPHHIPSFDVLVGGQLADDIKDKLNKQIRGVCDIYLDLDANQLQIRRRLERIAATLPKYQAKYVEDWVNQNLDEVDVPKTGTILRRSS